MDEIDKLNEQADDNVRRAFRTVAFEFRLPVAGSPRHQQASAAQDGIRDGLLEALRVDAELEELAHGNHPKVLGIAVDPPELVEQDRLYRVHIDFSPGEVNVGRVREIIRGNLDAELVASA